MDKNTITGILARSDGYISGQSLAGLLGVSRQAVWKEITALKRDGYKIESVPNRGYRLTGFPDYLNAPAVKASMTAKLIGCGLEVLDSVGSTNDHLKARAGRGAKSGTVAAAREQVRGKGRLGRSWLSKKDENIMFSVLLRPRIAPPEAAAITPLTGLAVCKALRSFTGLDCRIKWPNDIICGGKKLCGILTEMSAEFDAVEYIVTGVGINVDQTDFPEDISYKATSLRLETGRSFDKNKLLARVLDQLEEELMRYDLELTSKALEEYTALCATVGRTVSFSCGGSLLSGIAAGVAENGGLEVKLADGSVCLVNSGEVTAQGIY